MDKVSQMNYIGKKKCQLWYLFNKVSFFFFLCTVDWKSLTIHMFNYVVWIS